MTPDDATLDAMTRHGGQFVQQLAQLFRVADPVNRARILHTFEDYFVRYQNIARRATEDA
jgi:hypothetical protein